MMVGCLPILAAALLVPPAHAQFDPDGYEAAVGGGTYLDVTDDAAGTTRNGITMIWSNHTAGAWDFPDGSDSSEFVNANSLDDKTSGNVPGDTPEVALDFSGLMASTEYNIYIAARFHPPTNDEGGDISWGTTSGNLTLLQFNSDTFPAGSGKVDPDADDDGTLLLKVGALTSDSSGNFSLFVDNGLEFHQADPDFDPNTPSIGRDRTQWDGVLVSVVPEPCAVVLGCLGALMAVTVVDRRRRR